MNGCDAKVTDANQRRLKGCLGWTTVLRSMRSRGSAAWGGVAGLPLRCFLWRTAFVISLVCIFPLSLKI